MSFQSPSAFLLLLLLPIGALVAIALVRRRGRAQPAVRYTNVDILNSVTTRSGRWRLRIPAMLFAGTLVVLASGIAGPQARQRVPLPAGVVVLAIDTSASMNATDIEPTRLEAAQTAATQFVDDLPKGSQVGLVTYSDHAQVQTRPTVDHHAVIEDLQALQAVGATALGDALSEAITLARATVPEAAAGPDGRPNAAILLLADGENSAGDARPLDAAAVAAREQIPVYTVSLGTDSGTLNLGGESVAVPSHPSTLRAISAATGGRSFQAATSSGLIQIYHSMSQRFVTFTWRTGDLSWIFALAAIPLLAIAAGLSLAFKGRFP